MEEAWELAVVSGALENVSDAIFLRSLLNKLNEKNSVESLGIVANQHFEFGENGFGEAVASVQQIAFRINQSLLKLNLPERQGKLIRQYFDPFKPLLDYSTFDKSISTLRNQWLKPTVVDNLLLLEPFLIGSGFQRPRIEGAEGLASEIPMLITTIKSSKIDDALKKAINARLLQIEFSIRNYEVLGAEKVVDDVAAILGIVSLANEDADVEKSKSAVKSVKSFAKKVFKAIRVTRQVADDMKFLGDGAGDLAGYLEDFSDNV